jgi:hypothetical protein
MSDWIQAAPRKKLEYEKLIVLGTIQRVSGAPGFAVFETWVLKSKDGWRSTRGKQS